MKSGFKMSERLTRFVLVTVALAGGLAVLPGCRDVYSDAIIYEVRTDPLFLEVPGDEYAHPDRPGQLPVNTLKDAENEENPFHKFRDKLGQMTRDPLKASTADRDAIGNTLNGLFGSPARPKVDAEGIQAGAELLGLDDFDATAVEEAIASLKLDEETLARGANLYRVQCLACHGVTGNGRGPSAQWVNPHPRDYRQGIFKFLSVNQTERPRKPLRDDLYRTLYVGIEGTSMPAFNLLREDELEALTSYVIHLGVRGEAEFETFRAMSVDDKGNLSSEGMDPPLEDTIKRQAAFILSQWADAPRQQIEVVKYPYTPKDLEASVKRGQAMFLGSPELLKAAFPEETFKKLYPARVASKDYDQAIKDFAASVSCVSCHKKYGTQALFKFDKWGTMVRPTNLTTGVYRGGRRPVDIYWRIHSGIQGSGMAAYGGDNMLKGEQIWDLVNFIQSFPYPARREALGIELYPAGT